MRDELGLPAMSAAVAAAWKADAGVRRPITLQSDGTKPAEPAMPADGEDDEDKDPEKT
jgi:hypothetical protein